MLPLVIVRQIVRQGLRLGQLRLGFPKLQGIHLAYPLQLGSGARKLGLGFLLL